ncbi:diguanylate cyclase [Idiomarina xiamenensis]|uniref:diguanylate cyclase n=1 Tax=Idiomarina xiamenensis 10-D-4 TaxID=740709 RepID=K2KJU2_9GAMM|nr:diguanylate cyclase [Idiomarina xiamenensis]EKE86962.1 PAS/PAC sensor-containing diguanylate cyclase [Idiomarina xiamenensis 10-D-4]
MFKFRFRRTLTAQLFWSVFFSICVAITVLIVSAYQLQRQLANEVAGQQLTESTKRIADSIRFMLDTRKEAIRQWSFRHTHTEYGQPLLRDESGLRVLFDNLLVVGADGIIKDEWPDLGIRRGYDVSERGYYREALRSQSVVISEPFFVSNGNLPDIPMINLSHAVRDETGKLLGVVVAGFDLQNNHLLKRIREASVGEAGYVALFSGDNNIIAHPDPQLLMKHVTESDFFQYLKQARQGWNGTVERLNYKQVETLQSFAQLPGYSWVAVSVLPSSEAQENAQLYGKLQTLLFVVVGAVLLLLIAFIVQLQLRKLSLLARDIGRVQSGQRSQISLSGYQDLDRVIDSFNQQLRENQNSHRQLVARQGYLTTILEASNVGMWVADEQGKAEFVNSAATRITGWPSDFFEQGRWLQQIPETYREQLQRHWQQVFKYGRYFSFDHPYEKPNGDWVWVNCQGYPVVRDGELLGSLATIVDISERYEREKALETAANNDPLTGLLNRRGYEEAISLCYRACTKENQTSSLLAIDLDFFKAINDNQGHEMGDRVLRAIGQIIKAQIREQDIAARIGGDEFVVVLCHCNVQQAIPIAEQIRAEIDALELEQSPYVSALTSSIGVAEFQANEYINDWLRRADKASYQAKSEGRNRVVVADNEQ